MLLSHVKKVVHIKIILK